MPARRPHLFRIIAHVGDLPRAERFYGQLLGFPGRRVWDDRTYFDCGGTILALVDVTTGRGRARRPVPLSDCIYFAVPDVGAVHARARRLGALSTDDVHGEPAGEVIVRPWGERSFYADDPWGNALCFVEASTLFTGRRAAPRGRTTGTPRKRTGRRS